LRARSGRREARGISRLPLWRLHALYRAFYVGQRSNCRATLICGDAHFWHCLPRRYRHPCQVVALHPRRDGKLRRLMVGPAPQKRLSLAETSPRTLAASLPKAQFPVQRCAGTRIVQVRFRRRPVGCVAQHNASHSKVNLQALLLQPVIMSASPPMRPWLL
jgi:hypothetical protein